MSPLRKKVPSEENVSRFLPAPRRALLDVTSHAPTNVGPGAATRVAEPVDVPDSRLAQDDSVSYGRSVRAFQVDTLTRTTYSEHEIPQSPVLKGGSAYWSQGGMHHLDPWWTGSGWLCAVDGYHAEYDWSIGIYTTIP